MTPPTPIDDSGRAERFTSFVVHARHRGLAARGPRPAMAGWKGDWGRGAWITKRRIHANENRSSLPGRSTRR